jgi:tRNA A-37 threonylcarbamoyl transferase component Bud32
MNEWIGRTLSKVQIQKPLGRGGMAQVYLGRHTTLNRPVAVKILHAHLTGDEDLTKRFLAEAQSVAGLRHTNIVQVFDFDVVDGRPYIVMELLEGLSLADYLRTLHETGLTLPLNVVARLIGAVASALDYAHSQGIIHRDIKPANIMLRQGRTPINPQLPLLPDVEPVLTDFGIARLTTATTQTATGAVLGTPAYMSPEQIRGDATDARSDIYSLGVVLYEMLAGQPPFDVDTTPAAILVKHLQEQPPPVPQVNPEVQAIVSKALAKNPDQRYQRAADLARDLLASLGQDASTRVAGARRPRPPAPPSRRPWIWAAAAAVLVLGGLGVLGAGWLAIQLLGPRLFSPATATPAQVVAAAASPSPVTDAGAGPLASASPAPASTPSGFAIFKDSGLTAQINDVVPAPDGFAYQAWLVGSEVDPLSLGLIKPVDGQIALSYQDPDGNSLLATYSGFWISLEPQPDPDPQTSGEKIYTATVSDQTAAYAKLLTDVNGPGALSSELLDGMAHQAVHYTSHRDLAVNSIDQGNLAGGKQHSEHVINILEGKSGPDYGDWNGDGRIENPGDDVGLIPYLQLLSALVVDIESAPTADDASRQAADQLNQQIQTLLSQAGSARDLATRVASADTLEEVQPLAPELAAIQLKDPVNAVVSQAQSVDLSLTLVVLHLTP